MNARPLIPIFFCSFLSFGICDEGANALDSARVFLEKMRIAEGVTMESSRYNELAESVAAIDDPETKFGYVVFSVARHSNKLLTERQATALKGVIERRKTAAVNWHDVRNIVRVHALMEMWPYALAEENSAEKEAFGEGWRNWTDLRLEFMFQEFVAQEKFQREAWGVLNPTQKEKLLTGEWKSFLKKSTGHGRLYSADKQVQRVLGKPDHSEAFLAASENWRERWQPMWNRYQEQAQFQRKREHAMDLAGEAFAIASWNDYAGAFRKFVEMEKDAIRDLVQKGYDLDESKREKVSARCERLRLEMIEKFRPNAEGFLRLLEDLKG